MLEELRDAWRTEPRGHQLALVCLVALGIALRAMYLAQPMRYDESVTYMYFARLPWLEAISTYTYPNNHVFHTLLLKISTAVFGNSPVALRLPAYIAGCLIVPATYVTVRALYGAKAALLATALVATSGTLVLYSTSARGYSLLVLAFLALVVTAIRLLRESTTRRWVTFTVIAALGLWTIPVMLFPLGAVALWFAWSAFVDGNRVNVRRLVVALAATTAVTSLLYSPIIASAGFGALTRNRFVSPSGWTSFWSDLSRTMLEALRSWSLGVPIAFSALLLGFALVAVVRHRAVSPPRFRVPLPAAALLWCAFLLAVTQRAPFARVWLWLVPLAAALIAAGLVYAAERWGGETTRLVIERRLAAVAVVVALGIATSVVTSFAVLLSRDTGTYRDAEDAVSAIAGVLRPGDRVLAGIPTNGPLDYYLHRQGADRAHLSLDEAVARRVFVVVDESEGQTLDLLTRRSVVRDSSRFTGPVPVGAFPTSRVYVYQRRTDPGR